MQIMLSLIWYKATRLENPLNFEIASNSQPDSIVKFNSILLILTNNFLILKCWFCGKMCWRLSQFSSMLNMIVLFLLFFFKYCIFFSVNQQNNSLKLACTNKILKNVMVHITHRKLTVGCKSKF